MPITDHKKRRMPEDDSSNDTSRMGHDPFQSGLTLRAKSNRSPAEISLWSNLLKIPLRSDAEGESASSTPNPVLPSDIAFIIRSSTDGHPQVFQDVALGESEDTEPGDCTFPTTGPKCIAVLSDGGLTSICSCQEPPSSVVLDPTHDENAGISERMKELVKSGEIELIIFDGYDLSHARRGCSELAWTTAHDTIFVERSLDEKTGHRSPAQFRFRPAAQQLTHSDASVATPQRQSEHLMFANLTGLVGLEPYEATEIKTFLRDSQTHRSTGNILTLINPQQYQGPDHDKYRVPTAAELDQRAKKAVVRNLFHGKAAKGDVTPGSRVLHTTGEEFGKTTEGQRAIKYLDAIEPKWLDIDAVRAPEEDDDEDAESSSDGYDS